MLLQPRIPVCPIGQSRSPDLAMSRPRGPLQGLDIRRQDPWGGGGGVTGVIIHHRNRTYKFRGRGFRPRTTSGSWRRGVLELGTDVGRAGLRPPYAPPHLPLLPLLSPHRPCPLAVLGMRKEVGNWNHLLLQGKQ